MGGERWSFGDHRTPIDFALVVKRPVDVHSADVEQVIRRLNTMRSTELCSYLQYKQHAYMVVSMVGPSVREEFIEHANEELRHADMLAERIQQLGGVPIFDPKEIAETAAKAHVNVTQGATVEAMVREDLDVEIRQVNAYMALIREIAHVLVANPGAAPPS